MGSATIRTFRSGINPVACGSARVVDTTRYVTTVGLGLLIHQLKMEPANPPKKKTPMRGSIHRHLFGRSSDISDLTHSQCANSYAQILAGVVGDTRLCRPYGTRGGYDAYPALKRWAK